MTTNSDSENKKLIFELFKLEYEQASQRYENIYKAIWQIFSYMAALAAAILAFGASNLTPSIAVLIALLPLLFWYFATYIPMDFYGEQARQRLAEIENNLNEEFLSHPDRRMDHYSGFYRRDNTKWRVKQAVQWAAIIALFIFIISFITALISFVHPTEPKSKTMNITLEQPVQLKAQDYQMKELKDELELLSKKLDSIESLIRERNIATPQKNIGSSRQ